MHIWAPELVVVSMERYVNCTDRRDPKKIHPLQAQVPLQFPLGAQRHFPVGQLEKRCLPHGNRQCAMIKPRSITLSCVVCALRGEKDTPVVMNTGAVRGREKKNKKRKTRRRNRF